MEQKSKCGLHLCVELYHPLLPFLRTYELCGACLGVRAVPDSRCLARNDVGHLITPEARVRQSHRFRYHKLTTEPCFLDMVNALPAAMLI